MIKFDFEEGVQFDPGFVQHLTAFIPNIEYIYADISRYRNFAQKKQKFKVYYHKILNLLENYLGFYLGCILWAACIKDENKPVLNNLCFGGDYSENETLEEVNFARQPRRRAARQRARRRVRRRVRSSSAATSSARRPSRSSPTKTRPRPRATAWGPATR